MNVGRTVKGTQQGTRPPAVVILLSDGGQTAGRYSPQQAAAWAKQWKIPISAVALGTPDGVVLQPLKSGYTERIQVPVQPATLQTIAAVERRTLLPGSSERRREEHVRGSSARASASSTRPSR